MKPIMVLLTVFLSCETWAWQERGNGGYTVKIDKNHYILDLVEAGLEESFNAPQVEIRAEILERLDEIFEYNFVPKKELAQKLSHLAQDVPFVALSILEAMKLYDWRFISVPLVRIDDIGETSLDLAQIELYQGAIRKDKTITINKSIFLAMNNHHRAALILHEMIYALLNPIQVDGKVFQDNYQARQIVAGIYSIKLSKGFQSIVHDIYKMEAFQTSLMGKNITFVKQDLGKSRFLNAMVKYANGHREPIISFHYSVEGKDKYIERLCSQPFTSITFTYIGPHLTFDYKHFDGRWFRLDSDMEMVAMTYDSEHTSVSLGGRPGCIKLLSELSPFEDPFTYQNIITK